MTSNREAQWSCNYVLLLNSDILRNYLYKQMLCNTKLISQSLMIRSPVRFKIIISFRQIDSNMYAVQPNPKLPSKVLPNCEVICVTGTELFATLWYSIWYFSLCRFNISRKRTYFWSFAMYANSLNDRCGIQLFYIQHHPVYHVILDLTLLILDVA